MEKEPKLETTHTEVGSEEPIPTEIQEKSSGRGIKALLFTLLGLLIISILIFGGFKLAKILQTRLQLIPEPTVTPTYEPTIQPIIEERIENWKVFKHYNPYECYSINYPANLDVVIAGATSGNPVFSFKVEEGVEADLSVINFFPDKIPPIYDLDKIQQLGMGGYYKLIPDYKKVVKKEEITIAGFRGLKVFTIREEFREHVYEYVLLPVENKVVVFQMDYRFPKPADLDDIPESVMKIVAQIINSFKQLKEPPLNWKRYSDERFPIGINYPPSWEVEQEGSEEDYIISFKPPNENFGESSVELHFLPKAGEAMAYDPTQFEQFVQAEENASKEALSLERYAFTFLQGGDYAIKVIPSSRTANLSIYFPCQDAKCVNYLIRADLFVGNEDVFGELSEIFDQILISFNKIFLED